MELNNGIMMFMPHEAALAIAGENAPLILDVRTEEEWNEGHVPGSVHIPMQELTGRLAELDQNRETIVICAHGVRSLSVARFLKSQRQFANVGNVVGGISAWPEALEYTC